MYTNVFKCRGTEFTGIKQLYEDEEILRYSTNSPLKSVYVENANAILENHLYKQMTSLQTAKWTNLLQNAVDAHNSRIHSRLFGLCPNDAHLQHNESWLRGKFIESYKKHREKYKKKPTRFKIGDDIRVVQDRGIFHRGYEPSTEVEARKIVDILHTYPRTYLVSGKGKRAYYPQEIVKIAPVATPKEKQYFIERSQRVGVKRHRSGKESGGQTQYLLKAKNDADQSSWISEDELQKLKDAGLIE